MTSSPPISLADLDENVLEGLCREAAVQEAVPKVGGRAVEEEAVGGHAQRTHKVMGPQRVLRERLGEREGEGEKSFEL